MSNFTRRELLTSGLAAGACWAARAGRLPAAEVPARGDETHAWLLAQAAELEQARGGGLPRCAHRTNWRHWPARCASLLHAIGGLPKTMAPPKARHIGQISAPDYTIDRLVFESLPGLFVSALLYRPVGLAGRAPAVLSLAGHTPLGKAGAAQQILAANLARRGYVVLATDPVGQAERSQFWNAAMGASPFGLACGEHAVLGNPLYLVGASLARYEIWDAVRGIDYLCALDEVDPARIGCVGASGGGTQTAYVAALDPRVAAAAIVCYITTLRRRMANRIAEDPDSDPEQDLFGFVSAGIDHAGLLALIAPRPLLLGTAEFDFFPIAGARETHEEIRQLYEVCGRGACLARVEVPEKHGLSRGLREATYAWFDRWLAGRSGEAAGGPEFDEPPRPAQHLAVCTGGQVNLDFGSRPLLALAWEQLGKQPPAQPRPLAELLKVDRAAADPRIEAIGTPGPAGQKLVLCVGGNETGDWRDERAFVQAVARSGAALLSVEPRLVGHRRLDATVRGHDYCDPLCGVEANLAYNALLVGHSLPGLRVADVLAAVDRTLAETKPALLALCGRRDAALVCLLAAALEPRIAGVAVEECLASFAALFLPEGRPINAASIVPGLLAEYGDIGQLVERIGPRRVLFCAPLGPVAGGPPIRAEKERFSAQPKLFTDWLARLE